MSFLIAPSQWDDFEQLFDKLVTDRYGPPSSERAKGMNDSKALGSTGSHMVSRIQRPKMDVVETDGSIVVTTELPGAKKERPFVYQRPHQSLERAFRGQRQSFREIIWLLQPLHRRPTRPHPRPGQGWLQGRRPRSHYPQDRP
ncbi:hypothetical protein PGTUg99_003299 [Puccinia graminis f. sp. tritici]|uniref:SHSP domain-containing protein n=1 Tax=Puccinia graminis f. sp. tritici TaxID=56615 RepID=A0A5B0M2C0_PUCGR|nr:hypothetical protein PGTUg99_003299 [Puccinia graminis f. sp. tritici]